MFQQQGDGDGRHSARPGAWRRIPSSLAVLGSLVAWTWIPGVPAPDPASGASPVQDRAREIPPTSLFDPRLAALRKASISWELRPGPARKVVDQVCLVPDVATFLEVLATWDDAAYFPILIDDVETTLKFLRAFRPAKVIRYARSASPIPADRLWDVAVASVGAAWAADGAPVANLLPGDRFPRRLGPTPPGVVLSSPASPMLPGAAALAAGRFQPLVRFDSSKRFGDVLNAEEVEAFCQALNQAVAKVTPDYLELGDSCDFVTLAVDAPYAYQAPDGRNALDDRLARVPESSFRWGFTGRLEGDAALSVYRAMCALFLQPESAAFFNGYEQKTGVFEMYEMLPATLKLNGAFPVTHVSGPLKADLSGWHATFDPWNKFGLVLINSSGSPSLFNLPQGTGYTSDIPPSGPTIVHMIHSFSAAAPRDPATIAGRWLANGAFIYYGSMNEPYLQSFRTARLITELIAERLPLSAVFRQMPEEPLGTPWRLVYFGDPLYRIRLDPDPPARIRLHPATTGWPSYDQAARPAPEASPDAQFAWALRTAIARLQQSRSLRPTEDLADLLLGLPRDRISPNYRPSYDALTVDLAYLSGRFRELRSWINRLPADGRSPLADRYLESVLIAELNSNLGMGNLSRAREVWTELVRSRLPRGVKELATSRLARAASTPQRRADWRNWLRMSLRPDEPTESAQIITDEIKRIDDEISKSRKNETRRNR